MDTDEVRRRYAAGESLRALATAYKVSTWAVRARLDTPRGRGRRPRADIDTAEIRRLHDEEGISLREIAVRYGVAPSTVTRRYNA